LSIRTVKAKLSWVYQTLHFYFIEKDGTGVIRVAGRQILHNLTDFELLIKIDDLETPDWNLNIKPNETKSVVLENELVRVISVGLVIGGKRLIPRGILLLN